MFGWSVSWCSPSANHSLNYRRKPLYTYLCLSSGKIKLTETKTYLLTLTDVCSVPSMRCAYFWDYKREHDINVTIESCVVREVGRLVNRWQQYREVKGSEKKVPWRMNEGRVISSGQVTQTRDKPQRREEAHWGRADRQEDSLIQTHDVSSEA